MYKTATIISILLTLFISVTSAQLKKTDKNYKLTFRNYDWNDINFFDQDFDSRPMIEINYGNSKFEHKNFNGSFSENGLIEFKIGYSSLIQTGYSLAELQETFLLFSRISPFVKSNIDRDYDYKIEILRGGFSWRSGIGYSSGYFSVIPYNQTALIWTKIEKNSYPQNPAVTAQNLSKTAIANDARIASRYNNSYRFSILNEAGLKIELGSIISFNGGYEINTIYPSVKTWEMLGSLGIEYGILGMLNEFLDEIKYSAPEATPIVNFVLKSAFHYAFYSLRQKNVNWPVKSETPLTFESFKIGTAFTF